MKLCYQVATPDVKIAPSVTAYQGSLEKSFVDLMNLGYDGIEFMSIEPSKLDWKEIDTLKRQTGMAVGLVCTGEIFGQLHASFTDKDSSMRVLAIEKVKELIDFASFLAAKINIGRVRGQYYIDEVSKEQTEEWLVSAMQEIADYAAPKNVNIAIEPVTIMQINLVNTVKDAHKWIKRIARKNVYMMQDTFHMNIEEKDILSAIREYSADNIHVHLCDNNRCFPGNCALDFRKIIQEYHDVGYDDCFCTEILQLPTMEDAARNSILYLAPIFRDIYGRYLKPEQ